MKTYLLPLGLLSFVLLGCNNNQSSRAKTSNLMDPNNIQREEAPADFNSTNPTDIQREEDSTDRGVNRGADSDAGSNDAAGMGMDE